MKKIYANNLTTLSLGRQGENLARQVVFDIRDLESLYGSGTVEVIHQRPGDAQPYPLAVQRDGTLVTWDVTATDTEMSASTANERYGKCELRYYAGETLAKSQIWRTWVESAMDTPSEAAPPEPEQGWVDQVLAVGVSVKEAADIAKTYANSAEQSASGAAQSAQEAAGSASAASTSATNAKASEESAAESASAAANSAASASASASAASDSASAAQQSATSAAESAAVYGDVVADVNQLKQDLTGLQTVVDSKADKTELAKTNLYLDALYKLNKGQTYDVLEQESEAYSVDVPSGAKYVGIDKVGGKSVVWNQLNLNDNSSRKYGGITFNKNEDGSWSADGTNTGAIAFPVTDNLNLVEGHKYLIRGTPEGSAFVDDWSIMLRVESTYIDGKMHFNSGYSFIVGEAAIFNISKVLNHSLFLRYGVNTKEYHHTWKPQLFDLTVIEQSLGITISTVEEFEAMFPADYYPYSDPTIISSQTDRVDVATADGTATQQITTNFPALNSAGSAYDYIDLNEGKLHQRVGVVDLGTLEWNYFSNYSYFAVDKSSVPSNMGFQSWGYDVIGNILCSKYPTSKWSDVSKSDKDKFIALQETYFAIKDTAYTDAATFKAAMQGVMLYYELAEEVITDIEIPTELSDWLTVEAGGSITFHNTDEGKRLLIPSKLSFVRKLDEVTV